jgi:hypothetical protein
LQNSTLLINPNEITIDAPDDAGNKWNDSQGGLGIDTFAAAFYSAVGLNYVLSGSNVTFSDTPALSGAPALFYAEQTAILNISYQGDIVTNDKGFVVAFYDPATAPITIISNGTYTIDNPAYSVLSGKTPVNQILSTGALGTSIGAFKVKVNSQLTTNETSSLPEDSIAANIATAIEGLINANIKSGSVDVAVTLVDVDAFGKILEMELEIKGIYSGKRLPLELVFVGVGHEGVFEEIQSPKPLGYNIITN